MEPPSSSPALAGASSTSRPFESSEAESPVVAPAARPAECDSHAGLRLSRYDQGKCSLEEIVLELYYGGIPLAQVEDCAGRLFGETAGLTALLAQATRLRRHLRSWLDRPIARSFAGVVLQSVTFGRKSPAGPGETTVFVAIGLDGRGAREVLAVVAATAGGWDALLGGLRQRGLLRPGLFLGEHEPGLWAAAERCFPGAGWQACLHRLEEQVMTRVSVSAAHAVMTGFAEMRATRTLPEARVAVAALTARLRAAGGMEAAALLDETAALQFTHRDQPSGTWLRLSDASSVRRLLGNVRARARALGGGFDGEALELFTAARLRHAWPAPAGRRFTDAPAEIQNRASGI